MKTPALLSALTLFAAVTAASAQVSLTLSPAVTPQPPGCLFTVSGTVHNAGGAAVFLNGLGVSTQDEGVILDESPFANTPASLAAGASFTGPLFTVHSALGGKHDVSVSLIGGAATSSAGVLAETLSVAADAFAETLAPSPVHTHTARLAGRAASGCASGTVRFRFGTSAGALTQSTAPVTLTPGPAISFGADVPGLSPLVTYFVQAVTTTAAGEFVGELVSFTTAAVDPAAPPFVLQFNGDSTRTICFIGAPSAAVRIDWSLDLASWQPFRQLTTDAAGTLLVTDESLPLAERLFYRAVVP